MKVILTTIAAAILASSFAVSADAATAKKDPAMVAKEAKCKAEANQKFTAMHPLKRRAHVKDCMAKM